MNNATKYSEDVMLLGKNEKTNHALNAYYITSWGKGNRLTMNVDYMQGKALSQYETSWTQKKMWIPKINPIITYIQARLKSLIHCRVESYIMVWNFLSRKTNIHIMQTKRAIQL
ncbi:hypothetical protein ABVC73_00200 [Prevotella melaninogenica]